MDISKEEKIRNPEKGVSSSLLKVVNLIEYIAK
jgi:hypothetical protein